MKRVLLLSATVVCSLWSLTASAQHDNIQPAKNSSADQPYKIDFNNISIGNAAYAQKVLRAWKDYDNNTLENSLSIFADNIEATLPDGTTIKGRDNFLKMIKEYRGSLASVESRVHACTTLKSPDAPELEIVSIWGIETDTKKDGTSTKTHLNEVWFFNKEGKVVQFHQMAAKASPEEN